MKSSSSNSPTPGIVAVSPSTKWTPAKLSALGLKLTALQYKLPFNDYSADLVERLFHDLMKSVDTNKKLMIEVRTLKEKNIQVETSLRNLLIQKESQANKPGNSAGFTGPLESRLFRLNRLVESLLFISSKLADTGTAEPWSGASLNLLNLLVSYEKALAEGPSGHDKPTRGDNEKSRNEFPPFLKEFHSVWKAQEERDELSAKLQEKETEISHLFLLPNGNGDGDRLLAEHRERLFRSRAEADLKLLARVEQLREAVTRKLQAGDVKEATSILGEMSRLQEKVKELEILKQEQSDMILRLEKKLASILKKERKNLDQATPADSSLNQHPNMPLRDNSYQGRIYELEALEIAKDAWRTERQLLESSKEQLEQELATTKQELKDTKEELDLVSRRSSRLLSDLDRVKDELAFSKNRISFFEKSEIERQASQSALDKQLRESEKSVMELRVNCQEKERALEEASNRLNDASRTIIAQDAQIGNISRENRQLASNLNATQEHLMNANMESRRLEQELGTAVARIKIYDQKVVEFERQHEATALELAKHKELQRASECSQDEMREISAAYKDLTETAKSLEQQLLKISSEKQAYKQALLEAREQWRVSREQFSSLQSRYRTLLSEYENRHVEKEDVVSRHEGFTSLPPSLKSGTRKDVEEELQQMKEYMETLQKELNVFRKSRDAAIGQRQLAIEKLKKSEHLRMDLESQIRSLKSGTQLLQKRLKNYIHRCDLLETIVGKQRNHILNYNIPMLESPPPAPSSMRSDFEISSSTCQTNQPAVRRNEATNSGPDETAYTRQHEAPYTPDVSGSRPSDREDDRPSINATSALADASAVSSRCFSQPISVPSTRTVSLPSSPRATEKMAMPHTLPLSSKPSTLLIGSTPYPCVRDSASAIRAPFSPPQNCPINSEITPDWNSVGSEKSTSNRESNFNDRDDIISSRSREIDITKSFRRDTLPMWRGIDYGSNKYALFKNRRTRNQLQEVARPLADSPLSVEETGSKDVEVISIPSTQRPIDNSLLWISSGSQQEDEAPQAWSAGPSSQNVTQREKGDLPQLPRLATQQLKRMASWQEDQKSSSFSPSSSPASSTMSLSQEDIERSTSVKGCPIQYGDLETAGGADSACSYSISETQRPVSTTRYYTDSVINGDKSSLFKLSSSSD